MGSDFDRKRVSGLAKSFEESADKVSTYFETLDERIISRIAAISRWVSSYEQLVVAHSNGLHLSQSKPLSIDAQDYQTKYNFTRPLESLRCGDVSKVIHAKSPPKRPVSLHALSRARLLMMTLSMASKLGLGESSHESGYHEHLNKLRPIFLQFAKVLLPRVGEDAKFTQANIPWVSDKHPRIERNVKEIERPCVTSSDFKGFTATSSSPFGLAVHPITNHIFVADAGLRCVHVLKHLSLVYEMRFPDEGHEAYIGSPRGIDISSDGIVAVSDYDMGQVHLFATKVLEIPEEHDDWYSGDQSDSPAAASSSISEAQETCKKVTKNKCRSNKSTRTIQKLAVSHIRSICRSGCYPGDLYEPEHVALDQKGYVYVSEWRSNTRIQKFSLDGAHVWATPAPPVTGSVRNPRGIMITHEHSFEIRKHSSSKEKSRGTDVTMEPVLYALGRGGNRVQVMRLDGRFVGSIPILPTSNTHGNTLCRSADGGFAVADCGSNQVIFYSQDGSVLHKIFVERPIGIRFAPTGEFYVASMSSRSVIRF